MKKIDYLALSATNIEDKKFYAAVGQYFAMAKMEDKEVETHMD